MRNKAPRTRFAARTVSAACSPATGRCWPMLGPPVLWRHLELGAQHHGAMVDAAPHEQRRYMETEVSHVLASLLLTPSPLHSASPPGRMALWTASPGLPCHLLPDGLGRWEVLAEDVGREEREVGVSPPLFPFLALVPPVAVFLLRGGPLSQLQLSLGSSHLTSSCPVAL